MMNPCPRCRSTDIYESRGYGPGIAALAFLECRKCYLMVMSNKGEIHLARTKWNALTPERLTKGMNLYLTE